MSLNILVVGGGITGLTAALALHAKGHHITVLERYPDIPNIGGPMSIRPAAVRVLRDLGLSQALENNREKVISTFNFQRYDTGEVLHVMDQAKSSERVFGDESIGFSRQTLHKTLREEVEKRGIKVRMGVKVVGLNEEEQAVRLEGGGVLKADLIIGADGVSSAVREAILPQYGQEKVNTILSCWMVKVPLNAVKEDPLLSKYLTMANWWYGPGRMVIGTVLQDQDVFDLHFYINKELGEPGAWKKMGDINDIREHYLDFEPVIFKFLDLVSSQKCYVWRVSGLTPPPTWLSNNRRVVIIGDAAHAMVPYAAQGASQGIEDCGVLAECLSHANDVDISKLLEIFEKIRKPRAEAAAGYSLVRLSIAHAPDGPIQQARDHHLKTAGPNYEIVSGWNGEPIDEPPALNDPMMDPYLLAHDTLGYAKKVLKRELTK